MAKNARPAPGDLPSTAGARAAAASFSGDDKTTHHHIDEGLYRLLVESVRDYAIFALDTEGTILTWNAGAERLKGYAPDEIIGKSFQLFYPPEEIAKGKPGHLLEIARREGHVEDEGWRVRKDGSHFWADVVITALRDRSGALVGYAKVTRDLTERRAAEEALRVSEERFRLIVSSVRDYGIFMLDPRGYIASWNEGAQRINGYTADEIVGRHFSLFYPQKDLAAGKPAYELKVAAREGRFEDEDWRVRKDGSLFWSNVVITALRNEKGELVGFAKVTRDLTERKAAEQRAIEDARRVAEAEAANRAKGEFLAAMSHELRTPLNAIGGYAELIEMGVAGPVTEQQREYLERVRTSQQHLLAIINDLLNYTKVESGQLAYEIETIDLHTVVENVLAMVTPQAGTKHITLGHGPCSEHTLARADRLKVEQIVLNLLSNAVKFTPERGRVSAKCGVEGRMATVTVSDTGPGIPVDKIEAIFEPFVQLGRTLSSIREGTGLGLAISRDLARAMDGDIVVESEVGEGSTFRLLLPLAHS
ncbi:MAG TPA: PAS domain-containing sensor histidine kinase [Gemmatimonadaceae bacterium]|nr:PAS domain-containing sensor histidine kinase [Gemmatimonadaceae bacterium]